LLQAVTGLEIHSMKKQTPFIQMMRTIQLDAVRMTVMSLLMMRVCPIRKIPVHRNILMTATIWMMMIAVIEKHIVSS
jgi:hypothetical protein